MLILIVITFLSLSFANPISFNISNTSLLRRAIPVDQGCHHQNEWEGRFCDGGEGPGVWHDQCAPQDPEEDTYFIEGNCPPGEQCGEYTDRDGDSQVDCITVPTTPDRNDVITKKLQVGKRSFNSVGTKKSKRHKVGIKIGQNYPGASVSAQVMGQLTILSLFQAFTY